MTFIAALDGSKLDNDFVWRIINCSSFNKDSIDSVILHKKILNTNPEVMDVLEEKDIKPYLKIDQGQYPNGTIINPDLVETTTLLSNHNFTGTKTRSIVHQLIDIPMIVKQQLTLASITWQASKIPIIEPEVLTTAEDKGELELYLHKTLYLMLQDFRGKVILKLAMPNHDNLYNDLLELEQVNRIVALSGGITRHVACDKLKRQTGMQASFSRALLEDLNNEMNDKILNKGLENNIAEIMEAS